MNDRVAPSLRELRFAAVENAETYLACAKEHIDFYFEYGTAKDNPVLVAAYMQAAAENFNAVAHAKAYGPALDRIADALEGIARAMEKEKT